MVRFKNVKKHPRLKRLETVRHDFRSSRCLSWSPRSIGRHDTRDWRHTATHASRGEAYGKKSISSVSE